MREAVLCSTNRREHFGVCATLRVDTSRFFEHTEAEHAGIELCFAGPGGPRHRRRFRGRSWVVAGEEVMVFNARERHVEECSANPTLRDLRSVIIHPGFVDALLADAGTRADELLFDEALVRLAPAARRALDALFAAAMTPGTSLAAIDCAASELVIELTTGLRHSASGRLGACRERGYYPGSVARAKVVLRNELGSPELDLEQVAARAGLSKFHFIRAFRAATGVTPIRYLSRLRVDVAKQKLARGSVPVTDVALGAGFADLSTFNKAFKRYAGVSPTQYRNFFRAGA